MEKQEVGKGSGNSKWRGFLQNNEWVLFERVKGDRETVRDAHRLEGMTQTGQQDAVQDPETEGSPHRATGRVQARSRPAALTAGEWLSFVLRSLIM